MARERDRLQKRVTLKEEEKSKLEMDKDTLKAQISGLEREVDQTKRLTDNKQKQLDDLLRERDNTKKLLRKTETEVDRKEDLIKLQVLFGALRGEVLHSCVARKRVSIIWRGRGGIRRGSWGLSGNT